MSIKSHCYEFLLSHAIFQKGFSTGVVAAILFSMGLPLDELWKWALKVQAVFFWNGIRCQQSTLNYGVRPKPLAELHYSREGSPCCMACIEGLASDQLDEVIASFSDVGTVHKAYGMLPEWWIVSGMPQDLLEFHKFLQVRVKDTKWRYIPSTIAAHSPLLSFAARSAPQDVLRLGLKLKGEDMKIPVWSTDTGKDIRASENILIDAMRGYLTCPAVWWNQITPLFTPNRITHVLDFGPEAGVASLTEKLVTGSDIQVFRCSATLGRRRLFKELLPALE